MADARVHVAAHWLGVRGKHWVFEESTLNRVQLETDIRNERNQAAIERLVAMREGVLRMYQRRQRDTIGATVIYSVLVAE